MTTESEEPGRYAAPQVHVHLREDPDRGGLIVQTRVSHPNREGAPYERHAPGLEAALAYIGAFWRNSAPGRDAAAPPAAGIEWGYRYRLVRNALGTPGRAQVIAAGSRDEAEQAVAEFLAEDAGKWEAEVVWRTPAVEAGPWHSVKLTAADAMEEAAAAAEDGEEASPQVLAGLIILAGGVMIPAEVIATWTTAERDQAARWAAAEHLHASDHPDVARLIIPPFVARTAEICVSPALAQLAVENWVTAKERLENSAAACAEDLLEDTEPLARAAQDAITGLLVLLKDRSAS